MKNVKAYVRTTLTAGLILAAAVLGALGSGSVKGFAMTLALGIVPAPNLLLPPMLLILIRRNSNTAKRPDPTRFYLKMPLNRFWKKKVIHSPRLISPTFSRMILL